MNQTPLVVFFFTHIVGHWDLHTPLSLFEIYGNDTKLEYCTGLVYILLPIVTITYTRNQ